MSKEICEVRIQTEGHQGGYFVRIVDEDDTKVYQIHKSDLEDIVKQIQTRAVEKGNTAVHWKKVS